MILDEFGKPMTDPICPECRMSLSIENMAKAASIFPPEALCKHGVTHPPAINAQGYLSSGPHMS